MYKLIRCTNCQKFYSIGLIVLTYIRIFQHHQLTDLLAGYNKLNVVPPEIGQLTALSVLDLRYDTIGVI